METNEKLKNCYKYIYNCDKCNLEYGSDKKEKSKHICPICEGKVNYPPIKKISTKLEI